MKRNELHRSCTLPSSLWETPNKLRYVFIWSFFFCFLCPPCRRSTRVGLFVDRVTSVVFLRFSFLFQTLALIQKYVFSSVHPQRECQTSSEKDFYFVWPETSSLPFSSAQKPTDRYGFRSCTEKRYELYYMWEQIISSTVDKEILPLKFCWKHSGRSRRNGSFGALFHHSTRSILAFTFFISCFCLLTCLQCFVAVLVVYRYTAPPDDFIKQMYCLLPTWMRNVHGTNTHDTNKCIGLWRVHVYRAEDLNWSFHISTDDDLPEGLLLQHLLISLNLKDTQTEGFKAVLYLRGADLCIYLKWKHYWSDEAVTIRAFSMTIYFPVSASVFEGPFKALCHWRVPVVMIQCCVMILTQSFIIRSMRGTHPEQSDLRVGQGFISSAPGPPQSCHSPTFSSRRWIQIVCVWR